jgi:hypothetical protein
MAFTEFSRQLASRAVFWTTKGSAARCVPPLDTDRAAEHKPLAMSDAGQHRRVQAKLRELIERASSAADASLHRGIKAMSIGICCPG